jgi:hypothetical protein
MTAGPARPAFVYVIPRARPALALGRGATRCKAGRSSASGNRRSKGQPNLWRVAFDVCADRMNALLTAAPIVAAADEVKALAGPRQLRRIAAHKLLEATRFTRQGDQRRRAVDARHRVTRSRELTAQPPLTTADVQRSSAGRRKQGTKRRPIELLVIDVVPRDTCPPRPLPGVALPCVTKRSKAFDRRMLAHRRGSSQHVPDAGDPCGQTQASRGQAAAPPARAVAPTGSILGVRVPAAVPPSDTWRATCRAVNVTPASRSRGDRTLLRVGEASARDGAASHAS